MSNRARQLYLQSVGDVTGGGGAANAWFNGLSPRTREMLNGRDDPGTTALEAITERDQTIAQLRAQNARSTTSSRRASGETAETERLRQLARDLERERAVNESMRFALEEMNAQVTGAAAESDAPRAIDRDDLDEVLAQVQELSAQHSSDVAVIEELRERNVLMSAEMREMEERRASEGPRAAGADVAVADQLREALALTSGAQERERGLQAEIAALRAELESEQRRVLAAERGSAAAEDNGQQARMSFLELELRVERQARKDAEAEFERLQIAQEGSEEEEAVPPSEEPPTNPRASMVADLTAQVQELSAQGQTLQAELQYARADAVAMRESMGAQEDVLRGRLGAALARAEEVEREASTLDVDVTAERDRLVAQNEHLTKQVQEYAAAVALRDGDDGTSAALIAAMEEQQDLLRQRLDAALQARDDLTLQARELSGRLGEYDESATAVEAMREINERQAETLRERLDQAADGNSHLSQQVQEYSEMLRERDDLIERLQDDLDAERSSQSAQGEANGDRMDRLEEEKADLVAQLQEMAGAMQLGDEAFSDMDAQVQLFDDHVESLSARLDAVMEENAVLLAALSEQAEAPSDGLETTIAEMKRAALIESREVTDRLVRADAALRRMDEDKQALEARLASGIGAADPDAAALRRRVRDLESELSDEVARRHALDESYLSVRTRLEDKAAEVADLSGSLEQLLALRRNSQSSDAEAELESLRSKLTDANAKYVRRPSLSSFLCVLLLTYLCLSLALSLQAGRRAAGVGA